VTTVIAVYAAVVATASLGWGVFTWWKADRTVLRVSVHGDIKLSGTRHLVTRVRVTVMNDSPFDATIHRVFVYSFGTSERMWLADTGEQGLPLTVPARQRGEFSFAVSEGLYLVTSR
jgi:hypothetical protein